MPKLNQFKPGPEPGSKFGKLTVIGPGEPMTEGGRSRVATSICVCACGNTVTLRNYVLTRKAHPAQSCGCTRRHGHGRRSVRSRTYRAWADMKTRCRRDPHYTNIKIYDYWIHDYSKFLEDMGECSEGLTLDRIDPKGNYEPGNCRWATYKQQANNKTNNRVISHNGESLTVMQWMNKLNLDNTTFYRRLKLGWTELEAATTPKFAKNAKRKNQQTNSNE